MKPICIEDFRREMKTGPLFSFVEKPQDPTVKHPSVNDIVWLENVITPTLLTLLGIFFFSGAALWM